MIWILDAFQDEDRPAIALTLANQNLQLYQGTGVGEWQGYVLRAGAWAEKKMCSIKGPNDLLVFPSSRAFGPEAPSTSASRPIDAVWGDDVGKAQFHQEMVFWFLPCGQSVAIVDESSET